MKTVLDFGSYCGSMPFRRRITANARRPEAISRWSFDISVFHGSPKMGLFTNDQGWRTHP